MDYNGPTSHPAFYMGVATELKSSCLWRKSFLLLHNFFHTCTFYVLHTCACVYMCRDLSLMSREFILAFHLSCSIEPRNSSVRLLWSGSLLQRYFVGLQFFYNCRWAATPYPSGIDTWVLGVRTLFLTLTQQVIQSLRPLSSPTSLSLSLKQEGISFSLVIVSVLKVGITEYQG